MGDSGRGCLNDSRFLIVEDAKEERESWRSLYNGEGPHSALENVSPREFALLTEKGDLTWKTSSQSTLESKG